MFWLRENNTCSCDSASILTCGLLSTVTLWPLAGKKNGSLFGRRFRPPTAAQRKRSSLKLCPVPPRFGCSAGEETEPWGDFWTVLISGLGLVFAILLFQISGLQFGEGRWAWCWRCCWCGSWEYVGEFASLELRQTTLEKHQQVGCTSDAVFSSFSPPLPFLWYLATEFW